MAKKTIKESTGAVAELKKSLAGVEGSVQSVIKATTAANASVVALDAAAKIFGDLPSQIIDFNEALVRSSTLNDDFTKTITKTRNAIFDLTKETSQFGIGTRENLKIVKELSNENVKLLPIYKKNIMGLVDFSARMKAFGVDTKTSAAMIGQLTSNLDMTSGQLDVTRRSLVSFAKQTGQSVQEVVSSYSKNIKSFMDFLDPAEMNKSFMQFQVMARRMGMEANTLYGIATKFDTIQGAQQMGARLNQTFSALGIEFNALAVQEMEPKARVDYIAKKTRQALKVASTMGGREGRLITRSLEAAGIGDIATVRAFGAEGGGRGGALGAVAPVGRGAEAGMARRLNFGQVAAATSEELADRLLTQSKIYGKLNPVLEKFAETILAIDARVAPFREATATAAAGKLESAAMPGLERGMAVISGNAVIGDASAATLKAQGYNVTANTTMTELLMLFGQEAARTGKTTAAAGAGAGAAATAGAAGAGSVLFTNNQVKTLAMSLASEFKAALKVKG